MISLRASKRTTVILTPDAEAVVRKLMRDRELSFNDAVNTAILGGLTRAGDRDIYRTPTFRLGAARVSVDRAVQVAAQLEDDGLLHKREAGK